MRANLVARALLSLLAVIAMLGASGSATAQDEGIIDVKCNIDGAAVFVDGQLLGDAPLIEIIPAGRHAIRVHREGFGAHEQDVNLLPDTTIEIAAFLQRILPGLSIQVDVEGARVILDGKDVGVGNVVVDPTTPGEHELVVEGGEFGRYQGTLNVPPARLVPVQVRLRGTLGSLAIHSDPEGARILLDGKEYGVTPVTIDPVAPGSHSIRLSKEGRSDVLQAVVVEPGQPAVVDAILVAEGGTLEIKPSPRDGAVFVNGVEIGAGRQVIGPVKPGTYSIRVTASGHTDFIQPVQVDASGTTRVAARLQSFDVGGGGSQSAGALPVHERPGFWAGIGGGAAAVAAAVVVSAVVVSTTEPEPIHVPGTEAPGATITLSLP